MSLDITLIKDLSEAERLWVALSPGETIYDDWNFRRIFYQHYNNELFFYSGYVDGELVGLLPLELSSKGPYLEFFGGDYMEDNRVFIKPGFEKYVPEFYKNITVEARLTCIRENDPYTKSLPIFENKYVLPLTFKDSYDYIETHYEGSTRKKMRKRLETLDSEGHISILVNNFEDIELLFSLNVEQFKDKPRPSSFARPDRQAIFKAFLQEHTTFTPRMLTFVVNGEKQAVSIALLYKNVYESINTGICQNSTWNLKEYIRLKKFDDAISQGCTIFDAFVKDYGWKEKWGFEKIPQHEFTYLEK